MNSRKLSLFFLGVFLGFHLLGQQAQMVYRNYNTDHGLPSSEVYDILQDREGYIWISTDNGLSRFDGYTFQNFGPEQGLKNIVVLRMQEDAKGCIWMSTLSSKMYIYENQKIIPFPYNSILEEEGGTFENFYVDQHGTFHAYLYFNRIISIDSTGLSSVYKSPLTTGQLIYPIEDGAITGIIYNREPGKSFSSYLSPGDFTLSLYHSGQWKNLTAFVKKFGVAKRDAIVHRLQNNRILLYLRENIFLLEGDSLLWNIPYPDRYNSFYESKEGVLYFGLTGNKGLRIYENLEALRTDKAQTYFEGLTISHILEDRDGALWVASLEHGIYYITGQLNKASKSTKTASLKSQGTHDNNGFFYSPIQHYQLYNQASGLSDDYITTVCLKNENEIFIGQKNGNIAQLTIKPPDLKIIYSSNPSVNDLAYDPIQKRLWAAFDDGLRYWDGYEWTRVYLLSPSNTKYYALANRKFALYPENGEIWGCNIGPSGFTQVDAETAEVLFYSGSVKELTTRTHIITKDFSGELWLGRNKGLFKLDNKKSLIPLSSFHPAFELRIEDIAQLRDSTLVIGSKGGGIVLWKENSFQQLRQVDGLTSNMIEKIHVDADQNIWVGTLNGLNKVVRSAAGQIQIENFTIADGMPSNEINDINSYGQQIWVATTRGLVKFSAETSLNTLSKPPIIDEIMVNQEATDTNAIGHLNHQQDNLSFKVLSFNYKLNGKIPYRYRVQDHEKWTSTDNQIINFAALSPGTYQFEVQAQNEDGFWSASTILPFVIRPPFWKMTWFISLSCLGLLSLFFGVYKYRINRLQKEAAQEREIYQLRQSALRAQMNPHFIFNCLNSIQGFIAEGASQKATQHLAKFSRLVRMVLNTSLEPMISLEEEIGMLHSYLQLEKMRFDDKFTYDIIVKDGVQTAAVQIPPLLTQPYVENAVIHGLANSKNEGHVQITYALKNNQLTVSVEDNGVGVLASKQNKIGNASLHKSVGMSITRKRLELIAGNGLEQEAVTVEEIKDATGLVQGTRVNFYIELAATN